MDTNRRDFVKKVAIAGTITTIGVITAQASSSNSKSANGVVKGKSPKREITYTKTKNWEDFYKSAL